MKIPFHKMNLNPHLEDLIIIEDILRRGQVVNGRWTEMLESAFKKGTKVKHAIACANATSGLTIAVKALNLSGRIAFPAFTWPSTLYALNCSRWVRPDPCDVNPKTWCMDKIPEYSEAAIAVDTFGNQSYIDTARPVIYDAAHGYGLKKLGQRGIIEVVSLAMTKAVTGMQGGMILTNSSVHASLMREMVQKYAKITEVNAYIALREMQGYDDEMKRRSEAVEMYCDMLDDPYMLQEIPKQTNLSVFAVLFENQEIRNKIVYNLQKLDMEIKIYYEPLQSGFLHTDDIYSRILALPTWDGVEKYIPKICQVINHANN